MSEAAAPRGSTPIRSSLGEPLAVAAAGILAFGAVRWLQPRESFGLVCPSIALFGVYCPLCGGTRGAYALTTGDLAGMLGYNALLPLLLLIGGWAWAAWTAGRLGWAKPPPIPRPGLVLAGFGLLAVAYGVARNLPWAPFTALAP